MGLTHLCDDYIKFGSLDNCSTFPFENEEEESSEKDPSSSKNVICEKNTIIHGNTFFL